MTGPLDFVKGIGKTVINMNRLSLIKFYYIQDLNFLYKSYQLAIIIASKCFLSTPYNRNFEILRRNGNENIKKRKGLTIFYTFLYRLPCCKTTMWNCLILRFMEDVNKRIKRQGIFFSKPRHCSLRIQLKESSRTFDKQTKWAGIIATKTERTKIHILNDVFAPVASLDLKVPNMAWNSSKSTRKYISSKKYKTILIVNSLTILSYIR